MTLLPEDDRDQRGGGGYLRNHRVENFDDQRGGGGYRGGRDDHEPRPKNPIPDHPPYKVRSLANGQSLFASRADKRLLCAL